MELNEFLIKAKKNTYVAEKEDTEKKFEDGVREFEYADGEWKYKDRYFGYDPFVGQEVVWKNGKVVWVMNYCGKVLKDVAGVEEIYKFLKKALLKPNKLIPLRGPEKFEEGDFKYLNVGGGDLDYFQHIETIFYKGERVYELTCQGGKIND
ncbi:hypothetical protein KKE19_04455 [Patescibacteria group bacterium]|nr:hypothetical protein [Patescibacteria group bacterium]MBU4275032.1 hypothetical protein [Patescibacteria group bacterium]MBU4367602.1 hypothetical protein [Patescibacteria group bacterium]MBU4462071.1 hypothetical protein [Patescibacteria group bacterium]MCG2700457.1 DUF5680 domain-containing protein [Candidatus Parcubacteria bacterium]